jgi:hypothetical protein
MASTSASASDLSSILTTELFTAIAKLWNPADPTTYPLPSTEKSYNAPMEEWHETCWPALLALSLHPQDSIPPLITFLPSPSSPDFLIQALGLTQLIDQAPRRLCKGIDERWVCGFFAPLSMALNIALQALPQNLVPDSKARWMDDLGATYEYWLLIYRWYSVPWVHSDVLAHQEIARERNVFLREEVEKHFGVKDPWRDMEEEIRTDTKGFARVARKGPPKDVGTAEHTFWYCMLLDVHYPIVAKVRRDILELEILGRVVS